MQGLHEMPSDKKQLFGGGGANVVQSDSVAAVAGRRLS